MKSLSFIVITILCASCAPKGMMPVAPVTKQPPVSQPIQLVVAANQKTERAAQKVKDSADVLGANVATIQGQMTKIVEDAKNSETATKGERDAYIALTMEANNKVTELSRDYATTKAAIADLQDQLKNAGEEIQRSLLAAVEKDAECSQLREQESTMAGNQKIADKEIRYLKTENGKLKPDADKWNKLRWSFYCFVGLVIAYIILKVLSSLGKITLPFAI